MNKPFTLQELNSLKLNDWIWIIYIDTSIGTYGKIIEYQGHRYIETTDVRLSCWSVLYGKTWIAYKNKELAEASQNNIPLKLQVQALQNTCYFKEAYIQQLKEDLERAHKELRKYRREESEN